MDFTERYFLKHEFLPQQIKEPPSGLLNFAVVIPAYLEDSIIASLESLRQTKRPSGDIEVILVFNHSEADSPKNKKHNTDLYEHALKWCETHTDPHFRFYCILAADLSRKHAGAGLARKTGMDEALRRFGANNNKEGLILSLDADTTVEPDYFTAIEQAMQKQSGSGGCVLQFKHDLKGTDYSPAVYQAIAQYELHLRYYKQALHYSGFPYVHHTVGSCFGVKSGFYAGQGGMNRRQAGEDFYFLNKLFPHKPFVEINRTCVHPSPRPSKRVPFGTGPAVAELISRKESRYFTYSLNAFEDLAMCFSKVSDFHKYDKDHLFLIFQKWNTPLKEFLLQDHFFEKIHEIKTHTASPVSFRKRFFLWFDAFKAVRYLNYAHAEHYTKQPVITAAGDFLNRSGLKSEKKSVNGLLEVFRKLDERQTD